ncbi:phage virion morphogenesis protein [Azoarcus communis]|uniref:phage virion morphogenesis protein n=1 Tax=Parazoarcus communis TaxID=41977 RepID=UPI0014599BC0|nr:phage virion morphogenesis protein [Parazoarcus communis]NMG48987.1 phage virion morphogenesis protein [Parazoarcus communis]
MIQIEINDSTARRTLGEILSRLSDGRPLFQRIAQALEAEADANFAAQGRPAWVPHSAATIAARQSRSTDGTVLKILQDVGTLASSISSDYGPDFALIGAGGAARAYAAIHQFGGTINFGGGERKVRLRTDAKGGLVRQGTEGRMKNLAVFAKDKHKRVRESWAQVDAYQVTIPARPYLPFTGTSAGATLQPEAARSVMDVLTRFLSEPLG